MAEQERKKKAPPPADEGGQAEATAKKSTSADEVDELLDEIDEVLETNAEEFVRSYVQKGGQAIVPVIPFVQIRPLTGLILAGILFWLQNRLSRAVETD